MKRLWIVLLCAFAMSALNGCSSSDEKSEESQAAATDSQAASADAGAAGAADELALDDGTGAVPPAEGAQAEAAPAPAPTDDITADFNDNPAAANPPVAEPPPTDQLAENPPPADAAPTDQAALAPPMDTPPPSDALAGDAGGMATPGMDTASADIPVPAPAPKASLKKVRSAPFKADSGRLMNAVYLARPGDTYKTISEKLYGPEANKVKDLKADNPFIKKPKPGDKVYYNSPSRPDDATTLATYYEDKGVPAQTYTAQDGDDLKAVSENLLGFKEGWKEVWTTNPTLESKGALTSGTTFHYWKDDTSAAPVVAQNDPTPAPAADTGAALPPPPPPVAAGQVEPPPPPPAPPTDVAPPPPPVAEAPPPPPVERPSKKRTADSGDQDTTMALVVGAALVLGGGAVLTVVRKNRARRMRLSQTQV